MKKPKTDKKLILQWSNTLLFWNIERNFKGICGLTKKYNQL